MYISVLYGVLTKKSGEFIPDLAGGCVANHYHVSLLTIKEATTHKQEGEGEREREREGGRERERERENHPTM